MAPTFASAAAGNSANSSRADSGGDWTRRATNGATQTFRRPSHATTPSGSTSQAHLRDPSGTPHVSSPNPAGLYVPPHAQSGRSGFVDGRYPRDLLLDLWDQREAHESKEGLSSLYVGNWEPNVSDEVAGTSWGRRDDHGQVPSGVDLCWAKDGDILPLSLHPMSEEEKDTFTSSVNSPIKPLAQPTAKDGTPKEGVSLRKTSISGSAPYGISSPTPNRPVNRRRETSEAYPFPPNSVASPSASRFSREDTGAVTPPPALQRRRTDFREPAMASESADDRDKDKEANPFSSLKRTATGPFSAAASATTWTATAPATSYSPMGAFGSFANPQAEKKPGYGSVRGESRFKGLMSKASTEDFDKAAREKSSLGNLGKLTEPESSKSTASWMEARSSRPMHNETASFPDDEPRSGSAALKGGEDLSPPHSQGYGSFNTPHKRDQRDESGFSAFGMTADGQGLRDIFNGRDNLQQTPQHRGGAGEPMSPTDTNPYQSPEHTRTDDDEGDTDGEDTLHQQYPGMGSFQTEPSAAPGQHGHHFGGLAGFGRVSQPFEVAASDRSQTSSVGPTRGFPTLPGLGGLSGLGGSSAWAPGQQQTIGTPVRERGLGGFDMFGSVGGDAQSPSIAGLGNSSLFGGPGGLGGTGSMGRSSRLGSLFPTAMQEQMRAGDDGGQGQQGMSGSFGRGVFGSQAPGGSIPARDTGSPLRRGLFDVFPGVTGGLDDGKRDNPDPIGLGYGQLQSSGPQSSMFSTAQSGLGQVRTAHPTSTQSTGVSSPAPGQPPAPQQRQMVMPDRMRWIYRDPEGKTQGPFSGLEMHDWYKAGFFSPELLVKKYEEPDYEPLAQLIRRIGNSREPFLVPQIGIPHGPPTTQPGNAWAGTGLSSGATAGAQPPFANNFPTFGTTLTAEQQNALERRKQEEQYLMARQKEHLVAQQQVMAKQAQIGIGPHGMLPHQLQHHSSAHSLHSQPSYGSITSPSGYQPSPTQGPLTGAPAPVPGLFDTAFRPAPSVPGLGPIGPGVDHMLGNIREEEAANMMERLNLGRTGQHPLGTAPMPFGQQQLESNMHAQQVVTMLGDRARLQREQSDHDSLQRGSQSDQQAAQASAERLQHFHDLRVQTNLDQGFAAPPPEGVIGKPSALLSQQHEDVSLETPVTKSQSRAQVAEDLASKPELLSLTEQVQKAASAKQSPATHSPWAKVEPALHPFPPPPSQSPLPAPAAQRKPIVADNLAGESRSRSETPSADTPSASIAPWAKEPTEAPKGPSLKEIQEVEAQKAAEREAIAQAARREALAKELAAQAQSPAAQPGLPSSSTWASSASPSTPVGGAQSPWAKPAVGKTTGQPGAGAKKTLQQIQKEEEARKQRTAANAAAAASLASYTVSSPGLSSGKRYADLASKHTPTPPNLQSGAWTTVGASGKVKTPGAAPPAPPAIRTNSSSVVSSPAKKPVLPRSTTMGSQVLKANAEEEFRKWAVGELRHDLNENINADDFVASLLTFPADITLIRESVHSASSTLDSRHFAEEFLRRRGLADKGIVDNTGTSSPSEAKAGGGGWSEVAKKGSASTQNAQQQQNTLDSGSFKVVAPKKKAGKR